MKVTAEDAAVEAARAELDRCEQALGGCGDGGGGFWGGVASHIPVIGGWLSGLIGGSNKRALEVLVTHTLWFK